MPQIILKQSGQSVTNFSFNENTVVVHGVVINCAERQLDIPVTLEIRTSPTLGAVEGGNGAYLAHINIPPKRYETVEYVDSEGILTSMQEALSMDPNAIKITLWPVVC